MRFTRIPLIATLLAGALSLLVVLPAIAQSTQGVETDGRESVGGALEVQVYRNITDIADRGIAASDDDPRTGVTGAGLENDPDDPYRPSTKATADDAATIARGDEAVGLKDSDPVSGYSRTPNPRNTRFNGRVYVSNGGGGAVGEHDAEAYNTILITAQVPDGASSLESRTNRADDTNTPEDETIDDGWTARVPGATADCAIAKA